ncbi:RICIN domain-containing protein [Streptosporangium amethystogenes subsp. fukuiense]|uniref:RICIN domain-containing protein n=1 Tax=Streptosporangium amethystogenes subsp. fukuiense TaxID=698418 RepID=A0ABW2T9K3_9ACTN
MADTVVTGPCAKKDRSQQWLPQAGQDRTDFAGRAGGQLSVKDNRFNGGGMLAVRLGPCSSAPAQRRHRPAFGDGVRRLVSVPSGKALSIGKEFVGKRSPTAFILYGPYTGSADQRITLVDGSGLPAERTSKSYWRGEGMRPRVR